jgi:protein SCO1/2
MTITAFPFRSDRLAAGHRAGVASRLGMGLLLLAFSVSSATAQDVGSSEFTEDLPEELVGVDIVEHLDETLPLDLVFTDDDGEKIKLRDIIDGERPTILQIGYFKCPMLCNLVLNEAMDGMSGVEDLSAGTDFDLVAVSINPNEGHELARVKKEGYLLEYARPGASRGFHFLTGSAENTKALADAVGFQYRLQDDGEYAHAAALFVITPDGRISRYLYGVRYEPATLRFALMEGAEGRIGSTLERFILWCHVYDPDSGSYHLLAFRVMQLGGLATVFVMVVGVGLLWLRDRRRGSGIESRDQIASPGAGR